MPALRIIIGRLTLFIAGFLLLVAAMDAQLLRNAPTLNELKYRELLYPEATADIAIFGSSITVHGIRPQSLASAACAKGRVYNFGQYGAQPIFYRAWYERLFRTSAQRPQVIVLALDYLSLDDDWKRLEQDAMYLPWRTFLAVWLDATWSDRSMMLLNRFRVFRAGADIAHLVVTDNSMMHRVEDGYIPLRGSQSRLPPSGRSVYVDGRVLSELATLVDDIRRDDIRVILVQMPVMDAQSFPALSRLRSIYRNLAESRGVPLVDFTTGSWSLSFSDPRLFSDGSHLNGTGSELLTRMLGSAVRTALPAKLMKPCRGKSPSR